MVENLRGQTRGRELEVPESGREKKTFIWVVVGEEIEEEEE